MTLQPGSILCLATIPFALVNSLHHLASSDARSRGVWPHLVNAGTAALFTTLAFLGAGSPLGERPLLQFARLWLPIVYYWWAYVWAGRTLHFYFPDDFSFDRQLIAAERRLFGNPSLWMALGKPRWLNEAMNFFYWSYYFYTPVLGLALYMAGDYLRFEAMALAVNLGYAISYSIYPFFPLHGPRWALVDHGLLPADKQVLRGHAITAFMNGIMWSEAAHKGGAMPSAHSSTCVVFMIWCARIWGIEGIVAGGLIGGAMFVSTVYGRYHYVIDVIVGVAIGLLSVWLADLTILDFPA